MDIAPRQAHGSIPWPKNTQKVPSEDQIKILIDPTVLEQVDAVCPSYLSRTAFINQAVDLYLNHLTPCDKLSKPAAQARGVAEGERLLIKEDKERARDSYKTPAKKDPFKGKLLNYADIPEELQDCADQIIEFWSVKKGTRSERAAEMLFKKLLAMTPSDRIKALDAAYNAQWASVFPPKPDAPTQSRHNHQAAAEFVHPAHRVFSNGQFEDEKDWPESKTGGKGVLDI